MDSLIFGAINRANGYTIRTDHLHTFLYLVGHSRRHVLPDGSIQISRYPLPASDCLGSGEPWTKEAVYHGPAATRTDGMSMFSVGNGLKLGV